MSVKTPLECLVAVAQGGKARTEQSLLATLLLGFLAGAYISIGCILAIRVGGNLPSDVFGSLQKLIFAGVFPVGLLMVLVAGADLFTGNCASLPSGIYCGLAKPAGLLRSWVLSWSSNLVGSIFVVFFLGYLAGLMFEPGPGQTLPFADFIVKLANAKCNLTWSQAFWRAVGCNWLVCLAIFMSLSADSVVSKVAGFWMPITAFVAIGWEHSVANMGFIPLGLFTGNDPIYLQLADAGKATTLTATWGKFFFANLVPVTLGNIVGAVVFVASFYYGIFGGKAKAMLCGK